MSLENQDKEELVPLLPYGDSLRPLILASNLADGDLHFVLQKRGVFVKAKTKANTIPKLCSFLLSPKEFNILKNRQRIFESNLKVSTSQVNWANSNKTVGQALPTSDYIETFAKQIIKEDTPYQLTKCDLQVTPYEAVISVRLKRNDWTKDVFSATSYHDCRLTISQNKETNIVEYKIESTAKETKDFLEQLQNRTNQLFKEYNCVKQESTIQKILSHYFTSHQARADFLFQFLQGQTNTLEFQKIVDIDTGINSKQKFPEQFKWLQDIEKMNLYGKKLQETEIIELAKTGVFIFGEIDAEFKFEYHAAKGTCAISYGFPNSFEKSNPVEFEVKVSRLEVHSDHSHVAKDNVKRFLLKEFQKNKYLLFERFKKDGKADTTKRNFNQFELELNNE